MAFNCFRETVTHSSIGEAFGDYPKMNDEMVSCFIQIVLTVYYLPYYAVTKKPNDIYARLISLIISIYASCPTIFTCSSLHFFVPNKCSINTCYLTYALVVLMTTG